MSHINFVTTMAAIPQFSCFFRTWMKHQQEEINHLSESIGRDPENTQKLKELVSTCLQQSFTTFPLISSFEMMLLSSDFNYMPIFQTSDTWLWSAKYGQCSNGTPSLIPSMIEFQQIFTTFPLISSFEMMSLSSFNSMPIFQTSDTIIMEFQPVL